MGGDRHKVRSEFTYACLSVSESSPSNLVFENFFVCYFFMTPSGGLHNKHSLGNHSPDIRGSTEPKRTFTHALLCSTNSFINF